MTDIDNEIINKIFSYLCDIFENYDFLKDVYSLTDNPRSKKLMNLFWRCCTNENKLCSKISLEWVFDKNFPSRAFADLILHQQDQHDSKKIIDKILNFTPFKKMVQEGEQNPLVVYLLTEWRQNESENFLALAIKVNQVLCGLLMRNYPKETEELLIKTIRDGNCLLDILRMKCMSQKLSKNVIEAILCYIETIHLNPNEIKELISLDNGRISKAVVKKLTTGDKIFFGYELLRVSMIEMKKESFNALSENKELVKAACNNKNCIFWDAIDSCHYEQLETLLSKHPELLVCNQPQRDETLVNVIKKAKDFPEYYGDYISLCFRNASKEVIEDILTKRKFENEDNIFHFLAKNKLENPLQILIEKKVLLDEALRGRNEEKKTFAYYCLKNNLEVLFKSLLKMKVPLKNLDGEGNHAIHLSLMFFISKEIIFEILKQDPNLINLQNPEYETPFLLAAKKKNKILKELLQYNPDLSLQGENQESILHRIDNQDLIEIIHKKCNGNPCINTLEDSSGKLPMQMCPSSAMKSICHNEQCYDQQIEAILKNKIIYEDLTCTLQKSRKEKNDNGKHWLNILNNGFKQSLGMGPLEIAIEGNLLEELKLLLQLKIHNRLDEAFKKAVKDCKLSMINLFFEYSPKKAKDIKLSNQVVSSFIEQSNQMEKSALTCLKFKELEKLPVHDLLQANLKYACDDLKDKETFLALVKLDNSKISKSLVKHASFQQKQQHGEEALRESLINKRLNSILPLIEDLNIKMPEPPAGFWKVSSCYTRHSRPKRGSVPHLSA